MTDEIKIYHVDDPNDAPARRLSAYYNERPTLNPFIIATPTALPQYVIPQVANSLIQAMQYYSWYSAYHQGFVAEQHQQQQQQQHLHRHSHERQQHQQQNHQSLQQPQQSHHNHLHRQQRQPPEQQQLSPQHQAPERKHQAPTQHQHLLSPENHQEQIDQLLSPSERLHSLNLNHNHLNHNNHNNNNNHQVQNHNHLNHNHHNAHRPQTHTHPQPPPSLASTQTSQQQGLQQTQTQTQTQTTHQPNKPHIKKPLNPFMIYMQKQRPDIVRQGNIKESAEINKMLGQQWRQLTKEEQEPYYKLAEQEKHIHAMKYPGWSARDNYANQRKKKKLKLRSISLNGADNSDKKCRARYGLNNQGAWCKPCRRKKKCILQHYH